MHVPPVLSRSLGSAWSVSLHPKGETYAASNGSGNVTMYSANPDSFGTRQGILSSGKNKHGMLCKYVRLFAFNCVDRGRRIFVPLLCPYD